MIEKRSSSPGSNRVLRSVLKFDSGRRGFTRAILALVVCAVGILVFAVYFFWHLL